MLIIIALIYVGVGIIMIKHPKKIWELGKKWYVDGGTPTTFSLWIIRIGGGVFIYNAILCVVALILEVS